MKFAHLADCHIGAWREGKLREMGIRAFLKAIDEGVKREVDFLLISGDLFNTSLPGLDLLKIVVQKLRGLKEKGIRVYTVAGSHDFSPSGKTMLEVLEEAGLLRNVARGEVDEEGKLRLRFVEDETGVKITGLPGRKGMLERSYYESLVKGELEKEEGYKIFMFHSAIAELKPRHLEKMEAQPLSFLPRNFNYYAGGHVHEVLERNEEGYGKIVYPGALFPNNFAELERYKRGGFYFCSLRSQKKNNLEKTNELEIEWIPVEVLKVEGLKIEGGHKAAEEVEREILERVKDRNFKDTLVLMRVEGVLEAGKPSDIDFKGIFMKIYEQGAYLVMKNTVGLRSKEFEEIKVGTASVEDIEEELIREHLEQIKVKGLDKEGEKRWTKELMQMLNLEKKEGETRPDFERRLKEEVGKVLGLDKE